MVIRYRETTSLCEKQRGPRGLAAALSGVEGVGGG